MQPLPAPPYQPPPGMPTIIHLDDSLIVLDKPAGLLSVPGRGPAHADSLASRVQMEFADARIVQVVAPFGAPFTFSPVEARS